MLAAVFVSLSLAGCSHASAATPSELAAVASDTLRFGRFGPVVLYRQRAHPSRVVLLVSGDKGWNLGVVGMAREIAEMDALVVGIDIHHYLKLARSQKRGSYAAADFEALSQWLQRKLNFPRYVSPILLGYLSGASLVYATLVQAPPGTFAGAISLGYCPNLPVKRTFCSRSGTPPENLAAVRDALARLDRAEVSTLSTPAPAVRDLPLVELPAAGGSKTVAVVVSGDGGWASIDRQIGETLSGEGVSVVGINSLKYFWRARTPDGAAADLTRILRHYMPAWDASRILLVGYSRGADVLPFMAARLPVDLRNKVRLIALLGFSHRAGFEVRLADFLGGLGRGLPTVPEIQRLHGVPVLCVYGNEETDSACQDLSPDRAKAMGLPGGHHFGGAYLEIARRILQEAGDR
jgi:type IV secretory pathway VirJ component